MAGLDLALDEQQALLRDAVQRLTQDVARPAWSDLVGQLGLSGLTVPEAGGGFGGGSIELGLVMAELGPALAAAELLPHAAACLAIASARPDHPALAGLASGEARAALICAATAQGLPGARADGRLEGAARLVSGGAEADWLVLSIPGGLGLVRKTAAGLTCEPQAMHDGTLRADFDFRAVEVEVLASASSGVDDLVRAMLCAEAVGLMQRMLADTADYLTQRRQFGAPIASFQALRHRLADMQLIALQAQALTEQALIELDGAGPDRQLAIAAASVMVRDAARQVGEGAVQLHGAMGLTEELDLGARFKRLMAVATDLGSEAAVIARYAMAEPA